jgi:hypothetical protein
MHKVDLAHDIWAWMDAIFGELILDFCMSVAIFSGLRGQLEG